MNLYLVKSGWYGDLNDGYYTEMVVSAPDEETCRRMHPNYPAVTYSPEGWLEGGVKRREWGTEVEDWIPVRDISKLIVVYLGESVQAQGVITSYEAYYL